MSSPDAANFDLQIQSTEDGPVCHVVQSPGGEASAPFVMPFQERELRGFWQQLSEPHQEDPDAKEAHYQTALNFGDRLFRATFRPAIHRCLQSSLDSAYRERAQLRIRLSLEKMPSLLHLPWEFLYDATTQEYLAQSVYTPFVRYVERTHQIPPLVMEEPLRTLVVIASPRNQPPLHLEREWLSLVDTLDHLARDGRMIIERLREPTLHGLQRQLRQKRYHILHFVGYGAFDPITGGSQMIFENLNRGSHLVNASHLGTLLSGYDSMRLAVLTVRQGGPVGARGPFVGAAREIVQRGVPGAVAFTHEPSPFAAITFLNAFYIAIASLQPLDLAVVNARQAVWTEERSAAWGAVAPFTRAHDAKLFHDPATGPLPSPHRERPEASDSLWLRYM